MNLCRRIQRKLVAGETLAQEEQLHERKCQDCRSFDQLAASLLRQGPALRDAAAPSAAEVSAVRNRLASSRRGPSGLRRLAWAAGALAFGVCSVVILMVGTPDATLAVRAGEHLVSLWEEVSPLWEGSSQVASIAGTDETSVLGELFEGMADDQDLETGLPESYQLLQQVLEDG